MRVGIAIMVLTVPVLCMCGGDQDNPEVVAEQYWLAVRAGDMERAKQHTLPSSTTELKGPAEGEEGMGQVTVGEATVDGDEAMVATHLTTGGEQSMEMRFSTMMVREAGTWKVDLDRTADEMTRSVLGVSASEIVEQMGEAMVEGMGEIAGQMGQVMTEAMGEIAEQMGQAMTDEPWTPASTGTVTPGMTREQVIAVWGEPEVERGAGAWMYLYFRNGCEVTCGTFDVVFLQDGQVVDAIVRGEGHTYAGVSSSPAGRVAEPTLPGTSRVPGD